MIKTLIINGKKLDNLYLEGELVVPFFGKKTNYQSTSHLDRAFFENRSRESVEIPLKCAYVNEKENLSKFEIAQKVVEFINHNEESEIQISGEDWFWKGYVDGPFEIELYNGPVAYFTLNIVLLENSKYSLDSFRNTAISDSITTLNNGTMETPFIVEATALKDSPYFMVSDQDDNHFIIGEDSEEVVVKNYSPSVITSEFRDKKGFVMMGSTESIPDRYLGGTTGASFIQNPETWSLDQATVKQTSGWRGGALSYTFDRKVQNFQTTAKFNIDQKTMGSGKIGQFIYDENGKLMFSMGYQNVHTSKDSGRLLFMAYNEQGDEKVMWGPQIPAKLKKVKILTVYMRIVRKGNKITLRYWCYDDTNVKGRIPSTVLTDISRTYNDAGKFYQRPASNSRFGIFRGNGKHRGMRLLGVYTYELLDKPKGSSDMIIRQGDIIVLNTDAGYITVNGAPMVSEKSFSSSYFDLKTGLTNLLISPQETFDTTVYWRDRYY